MFIPRLSFSSSSSSGEAFMGSSSFAISTSSATDYHPEGSLPTPTTALLSSSPPPPISKTCLFLLYILLFIACLTFTFAFLFSSSSSSTSVSAVFARNLSYLVHPTVILISSDGFRYGYQFKSNLPNINRLISNGTEAVPGLIPVFPTLTFPNHYSIVTGLYPSFHGIINNQFVDPNSGERFTMGSHESKWWLGEPLWETVVNHGLPAATYFWPGSEVIKGSWHCPGKFCNDNSFFSMRTIFIAHGPQFEKGRKVASFENVEIYNMITEILKLKGKANNGSASFPSSILLPRS